MYYVAISYYYNDCNKLEVNVCIASYMYVGSPQACNNNNNNYQPNTKNNKNCG